MVKFIPWSVILLNIPSLNWFSASRKHFVICFFFNVYYRGVCSLFAFTSRIHANVISTENCIFAPTYLLPQISYCSLGFHNTLLFGIVLWLLLLIVVWKSLVSKLQWLSFSCPEATSDGEKYVFVSVLQRQSCFKRKILSPVVESKFNESQSKCEP